MDSLKSIEWKRSTWRKLVNEARLLAHKNTVHAFLNSHPLILNADDLEDVAFTEQFRTHQWNVARSIGNDASYVTLLPQLWQTQYDFAKELALRCYFESLDEDNTDFTNSYRKHDGTLYKDEKISKTNYEHLFTPRMWRDFWIGIIEGAKNIAYRDKVKAKRCFQLTNSIDTLKLWEIDVCGLKVGSNEEGLARSIFFEGIDKMIGFTQNAKLKQKNRKDLAELFALTKSRLSRALFKANFKDPKESVGLSLSLIVRTENLTQQEIEPVIRASEQAAPFMARITDQRFQDSKDAMVAAATNIQDAQRIERSVAFLSIFLSGAFIMGFNQEIQGLGIDFLVDFIDMVTETNEFNPFLLILRLFYGQTTTDTSQQGWPGMTPSTSLTPVATPQPLNPKALISMNKTGLYLSVLQEMAKLQRDVYDHLVTKIRDAVDGCVFKILEDKKRIKLQNLGDLQSLIREVQDDIEACAIDSYPEKKVFDLMSEEWQIFLDTVRTDDIDVQVSNFSIRKLQRKIAKDVRIFGRLYARPAVIWTVKILMAISNPSFMTIKYNPNRFGSIKDLFDSLSATKTTVVTTTTTTTTSTGFSSAISNVSSMFTGLIIASKAALKTILRKFDDVVDHASPPLLALTDDNDSVAERVDEGIKATVISDGVYDNISTFKARFVYNRSLRNRKSGRSKRKTPTVDEQGQTMQLLEEGLLSKSNKIKINSEHNYYTSIAEQHNRLCNYYSSSDSDSDELDLDERFKV